MASFDQRIIEATTPGEDQVLHGALLHAETGNCTPLIHLAAGRTAASSASPAIAFTNTLRIASCTKLPTTIAALQLVERGAIALDAPLDAHLPELCEQPVIRTFDEEAGEVHTSPRTRPLTLRHLLTHTSGVGYDILQPALQAWRKSSSSSSSRRRRRGDEEGEEGDGGATTTTMTSTNVFEAFAAPLLFEPGQGWAYGAGLDWAGILVERLVYGAERGGRGAKGCELEDYMRERMWGPLGMGSSTFRPEEEGGGGDDTVRERLVEMAARAAGGSGQLVRATGPFAEVRERVVHCLGGSGMWSCVPDYVELLKDLLREEPRLLKRVTVEGLVFAPQLSPGSSAHEALVASQWIFEGMVGGAPPEGTELNFGMGGLLILSDIEGLGKTRGTLSWGGGGGLVWFANRQAQDGEGILAFFATQLWPPNDEAMQGLIKEFIHEVWRRVG